MIARGDHWSFQEIFANETSLKRIELGELWDSRRLPVDRFEAGIIGRHFPGFMGKE